MLEVLPSRLLWAVAQLLVALMLLAIWRARRLGHRAGGGNVVSAECGASKLIHSFTIFLRIFEIAVERLDAGIECGFQLCEAANQDDQVRRSQRGMIG